ncbi:MAG TPA: NifU family protein [Isosphaeraceae bacterium]|jgi:Fe-S cluster biogenesis protein NfuA|nr:NifU family protein [Isosphaeraceae bacterium]
MAGPFDAREFRSQMERLDALLEEGERLADPKARDDVREVVRAILDLHGLGLGRVLDLLGDAGSAGAAARDALARDEVVGGLLLLHGLHPLDFEARVLRALEQVRPRLRSHGGGVELLAAADGVVRLRLTGNCHGCPSSAATMRQTVEEAILGQAPDAVAIEVEGESARPPATANNSGLVVLNLP